GSGRSDEGNGRGDAVIRPKIVRQFHICATLPKISPVAICTLREWNLLSCTIYEICARHIGGLFPKCLGSFGFGERDGFAL
ncbi:MAG TPA: hypothetical protein VFV81_06175, partial [Verrucomicrobiae bacterium]|nr:hypothetical protein [Verrucomicrobiae bacterium]